MKSNLVQNYLQVNIYDDEVTYKQLLQKICKIYVNTCEYVIDIS